MILTCTFQVVSLACAVMLLISSSCQHVPSVKMAKHYVTVTSHLLFLLFGAVMKVRCSSKPSQNIPAQYRCCQLYL